jgi:hypothetical protein
MKQQQSQGWRASDISFLSRHRQWESIEQQQKKQPTASALADLALHGQLS